ncbi:MAG: hypothetical protein AAGA20_13330 [Planctomycetota bacterium]
MPLKPQDLLVALQIALPAFRDGGWTYSRLASGLGMSDSEANEAARRAVDAGLLAAGEGRSAKPAAVRSALLEFIGHGVRYAFYAQPGATTRGVPTAYSAPPLDGLVAVSAGDALVWPDAEGDDRGQALEPLYPSVPGAARRDAALHETLSLVDAVRVGRARERELAMKELRARIADG